jgi:hypothetical protein
LSRQKRTFDFAELLGGCILIKSSQRSSRKNISHAGAADAGRCRSVQRLAQSARLHPDSRTRLPTCTASVSQQARRPTLQNVTSLCCEVGDACLTWLWDSGTGAGCWSGQAVCIGAHDNACNGATRIPRLIHLPTRRARVPAAPLKFPIIDIGCGGLTGSTAGTAAACEAACCASASCLTWGFGSARSISSSVGSSGGGGQEAKADRCWSGSIACKGDVGGGWNGSSKVQVIVPPPPLPLPAPPHFAIPRLASRLSAVAGVADPLLSLHGTWDFSPGPFTVMVHCE